jgi:hypothetical protein
MERPVPQADRLVAEQGLVQHLPGPAVDARVYHALPRAGHGRDDGIRRFSGEILASRFLPVA